MEFIKAVKQFVRTTGLLEDAQYIFGRIRTENIKKKSDKKNIYFMLVPTYGNLGDQAIGYATERFLQSIYPEYDLIKINLEDTFKLIGSLKKVIREDDLIILQGGGNMGDLYPSVERARRLVLKHFRRNIIVSFPTTFTFTNTHAGHKELQKSRKAYGRAEKFTLIAREETSYLLMKKYMKNSVVLIPDIVFLLPKYIRTQSVKRFGILICLRRDKESLLGKHVNQLIKQIYDSYKNAVIFDTLVFRSVSDDLRKQEIESILNVFSSYEVVVTDRIHGMIFAVITGTPCVVLKSVDDKVNGTYKWIKEFSYIKFVEDKDMVLASIREIKKKNVNKVDYSLFYERYLEKKFSILADYLRGIMQ